MELDETPPFGCHHYSNIGEVPWDVQKYWEQRHSIFRRYDEGIWMTDDAWFGVTPEPIANGVADHLARHTPADKTILVDVFSGAGGNTIAFARSNRWARIIAIEKDAHAVSCARHNAAIYGVAQQIEWRQGDCFDILASLPVEVRNQSVVFASPPWGGPGYSSDEIFNLHTMQPYSLQQVHNLVKKVSDLVVLYLPRTSDLRQLAALVPEGQKARATHYCMRGAGKALCAYFGPFLAQS